MSESQPHARGGASIPGGIWEAEFLEPEPVEVADFVAAALDLPTTPDAVVVMEPAEDYPVVRFKVHGTAAPQGSKRAFVTRGARPRAVMTEDSKRTAPWRGNVAAAAGDAMGPNPPLSGPLFLEATFVFTRPHGHFTSKGALVKRAPLAPTAHTVGDIDKLARALEDALTGIVFLDDSQVTKLQLRKRYGLSAATYVTVRPDPLDG